MKIKRNPIANAIKIALYSSLIASAAFTNVALAQDEDDGSKEELDKVVVTGSNIRGVDLQGALPVTIIEREDLLKTGVTDVGDLLQRLPSFSGSPIGVRTNNGGSGGVFVDLRGIGSGRTLVLINGRRTVDGGDFQSIPAAMIERVEILKEGASAIYGADAVAGVVNIITRKDFTGVEIEAQYMDSFDTNNAQNKNASIIFGNSSDKGHFSVGFQYEEQAGATQGDTPYGFLQDTFQINDIDAFNAGGGFDPNATYIDRIGSARNPCGLYIVDGVSGLLTIDGVSPSTGDCGAPGRALTPDDFRPFVFGGPNNDTYNFAPVNYIQTPYAKTNIFFDASHQIGDVEIFSNFRYSHRTSTQQLAPVPYDTAFDPGAPLAGGGNGISADNVYNPFGADVNRVLRRMIEGNRIFTQDVQQYQALLGARGDLGDSGWTWEASYNFGFRQTVSEDLGQFIGSRLGLALGPSFYNDAGVATCGTPDAPIADCVPLNLFGGTGTVTPEMLRYVSATLVDHSETQLDVFNANVSGILFDMPAGPVGSAFGFEYRDNGYKFNPDSNKAVNGVTGNKGPGVQGGYDVTSLFTELSVPLLDSETNGIGTLDLQFGARYDDYSTVGSNTTVQGGFAWRPIDSLLIRGTFAEVFREPNVTTLFSGQSDSFPAVQDPCNTDNWNDLDASQQAVCIAGGVPGVVGGVNSDGGTENGVIQFNGQLRARIGGNPDVNPEQGETYTFGLAWSPESMDGFTATLDWWKVNLDDGITTIDADVTLIRCLDSSGAGSEECSLVVRRPNTGEVDSIAATVTNASKVTVEGLDAELSYGFGTDYGVFNFSFLVTHILNRETEDFAGAGVEDFNGRFAASPIDASFNQTQAKILAGWNYGDWGVFYQLDHYSGLDADLVNFDATEGTQSIASQSYSDLTFTYAVPWQESTLSLSINNVFDKDPPYIESGFNGSTDEARYRLFGRTYNVGFRTRF